MTRQSIEAENYMVAVERLDVWCHIPSEYDRHEVTRKTSPFDHHRWPESGAIVFDEFSVRYRKYMLTPFAHSDMVVGPHLPLVLDKLCFSIQAGEIVGVVGRTGCGKFTCVCKHWKLMSVVTGKSTLATCLFRVLEAEAGSILIDGVDIATIPLQMLRSRLLIVPQVCAIADC